MAQPWCACCALVVVPLKGMVVCAVLWQPWCGALAGLVSPMAESQICAILPGLGIQICMFNPAIHDCGEDVPTHIRGDRCMGHYVLYTHRYTNNCLSHVEECRAI
jgi:hypothetical protein